jgi:hypothetical protein
LSRYSKQSLGSIPGYCGGRFSNRERFWWDLDDELEDDDDEDDDEEEDEE